MQLSETPSEKVFIPEIRLFVWWPGAERWPVMRVRTALKLFGRKSQRTEQ